MITGWAGTGINDTAITMTTPRTKLYYRAGGFPIVKISKNSVSFPNDGIPLEVEHCPDSTEDVPEEADVIPVTTNEQARPLTLFASEGDCGVLAVTEEPT
jgi:hypothetical protein